jgi:TRAP-type C4-dicarboxylate transport system substrate-binding protein
MAGNPVKLSAAPGPNNAEEGKAMVRRIVSRAAAVGGLAALLAAVPAGAQQVSWKAALFGPPRAVTAPVDWFAKEVAARSGGQVRIEPVYGEALAKATEMPDGLRAGAFEMAMLCASYYPGKFPLYTVLDLPMFTPADLVAQGRVQIALGEHPAMVDEFKRWNVKLLIPIVLPQYQIIAKRRIVKVADLKGLRIRVSGEMAKVLEDYGAVKSLVPAPEVFPALDRGVIDAATFPGTYSFASFRLHEIAKYYIDKISLGTQPCFFGVNQAAWDRLSPAHQALLLDAREGTLGEFVRAYQAADDKNYDEFRRKGVEIIDFPPGERAKLAANARQHWAAWVEDMHKRGLRAREVYEFVQAKIKEQAK